MFRFVKWLAYAAALAGSVMLGTASCARADLELQLMSGSTTKTVDNPNNDGPAIYNGAVGDFNVIFSVGASNSPGGAAALAGEGTLSIKNANKSSSETITIQVSAQGFTSPNSPPPLLLGDVVIGSVSAGGTVSSTVQAYADAGNTLFGTGFSDAGLDLTIPSTRSFSVTGTAGNGFSPNGNTYSLTFVETFTLSAGATLYLTGGGVGTDGHVDPLPEPATLTPAFAAMLCLGFGAWLRRGWKQGGWV